MSAAYDPDLALYFQHVPKTAGTSVATLLAAAFARDEICPVTHWDTLAQLPEEDVARYRLFIGHYASYLPRYLRKPLNTFTVLRDPVERTISHYAYIVASEDHAFHAVSKGMTLLDFVLHPVTRHNVCNYQARYIADLGIDPRSIARDFDAPPGAITPLHMHIDELSMAADQRELRSAAIESLDRFFSIGPTDLLDKQMIVVARLTGRQLGPLVRANVTAKRPAQSDLDRETLRAIKEATQIDQEIYEIVRARAAEQFSLID
jgi:hypothetical protein